MSITKMTKEASVGKTTISKPYGERRNRVVPTDNIRKYEDTRPVQLNSFLLNGGYIYHDDGYRISFDNVSNYFIVQKSTDRYVFDTLESCACFLAFSNTERTMVKNKAVSTRYEWFVADLDEIYAVFSRKKDAIRCCYRLNEDKRVSKAIYRLDNGLYEYTGPAHYEVKHLYIGLRDTMILNGFGPLLTKWDNHMKQLIENEQNRVKKDILTYNMGTAR